jgi:hypothetical protein
MGRQRETNSAARVKRRNQIERLMLDGLFSPTQIAKEIGVTVSTIRKDIELIEREWADTYTPEERERRRNRRISQLETITTLAAKGFDKSKESAERETVTTDPKGKTTTMKETKNQYGDPALLNVMKNCITEISKLEGLHVQRHEISGKDGGAIVVEAMRQIPDEELDKIVAAAERLEELSGQSLLLESPIEGNGFGR